MCNNVYTCPKFVYTATHCNTQNVQRCPLTEEIRLKIFGSPDLTVFLLDIMGFLVQIYLISQNIHPKVSSLRMISSFCGYTCPIFVYTCMWRQWVCNTLQHTATHCNTLQHTATRTKYSDVYTCLTLQHTATHCNTLQHTASHCNTLQHTQSMVIEEERRSSVAQSRG